ncbi:hypothetical protein [Thiorhodovibrio frisius]|uniref:hypothetical protein n=1 Tax=Thiorhodovibrio frisius TaxID=631362 RepID=UPI002B261AFA|nr:hypothetical protein [Thiorhodovibrio frisius]
MLDWDGTALNSAKQRLRPATRLRNWLWRECVDPRRQVVWTTRAMGLIAGLLAAALLLQMGIWSAQEEFSGPMQTEGPNSQMIALHLDGASNLSGLLTTGGDSTGAGNFRSDLQLWVDGVAYTRPHTLHADLRAGAAPGAYSHWGDVVYFSDPDPSPHIPATVRVIYSVQPFAGSVALLMAALLLSVAMLVFLSRRAGHQPVWVRGLGNRFGLGLRAASWVVLGCALVYLASIPVAMAMGEPLPTAWLVRVMPGGSYVPMAIPRMPHVVLVLAISGAVLTWMLHLTGMSAAKFEEHTAALSQFWLRAGLVVVPALLLMTASSGGWAGYFTTFETHNRTLGGLVPYTDAYGHYSSAFDLLFRGEWNHLVSRRPLAGAFRTAITTAGGLSYVGGIYVQIMLIAACLLFALRALLQRYGLWAALAFFALAFGIAAVHLNTTMTEPLGLIWALLALAVLVESHARRSAVLALLGFALFTLAMVTRMGSMFAIPLLAIWVAFAFGGISRRGALLLAACGAITLAVLAAGEVFNILFSNPDSQVGGNVSYTFCGLARGTGWAECKDTFAAELAALPSIRDKNAFLFGQAFEALQQSPATLIVGLIDNVTMFFRAMPQYFAGYYATQPVVSFSRNATVLVYLFLGAGLLAHARRIDWRVTGTFWIALGLGVISSAALIFRDDGLRTLVVTHVFVAALLAMALTVPQPFRPSRLKADLFRAPVWAGGIAVALCLFLGAGLFVRSMHTETLAAGRSAADDRSAVFARKGLTGFLVGSPGPDAQHVPHIPSSVFARILETESSLPPDLIVDMKAQSVTHPAVFRGFTMPSAGTIYVPVMFGPRSILMKEDPSGTPVVTRFDAPSAPFGVADPVDLP